MHSPSFLCILVVEVQKKWQFNREAFYALGLYYWGAGGR